MMKKKSLYLALFTSMLASGWYGVAVAVDAKGSLSMDESSSMERPSEGDPQLIAPTGGDQGGVVSQPALVAPSAPNAGMPNAGMPNAGMPNAGMPNAGMPNQHETKSTAGLTLEERHYFNEQSRLQRDIMLMESKVKLVEQQAKYDETVKKMMSGSKPKTAEGANKAVAKADESTKEESIKKLNSEIIFVSSYGDPKNMTGEIFYRGGRIAFKRGDKLPEGFTVVKIDPTRLVLKKGKKITEINIGQPSTGFN